MSYSVLIFDHRPRFEKCKDFLDWYNNKQFTENYDFDDYEHATRPLKNWFMKMKDIVPPLNGQFAPSDENIGNGRFHEADYCIGTDFIYMDFAYSEADKVKNIAFEIAKENHLSYYDMSGTGVMQNFDGSHLEISHRQAVIDELEVKSKELFRKRNTIVFYVMMPLLLLGLPCLVFRDSWGIPVGIADFIFLLVFGYWANKWINRCDMDVLREYQQQKTPLYPIENEEIIARMMANIVWNFQKGLFDTQEEFSAALINYNKEITGNLVDEQIKEKLECIGAEADFILFDDYSEEAKQYHYPKVHFIADNGQYFTVEEILFKLNNELYPLLQNSDSVFFEGIYCHQLTGGPTICRVILGS